MRRRTSLLIIDSTCRWRMASSLPVVDEGGRPAPRGSAQSGTWPDIMPAALGRAAPRCHLRTGHVRAPLLSERLQVLHQIILLPGCKPQVLLRVVSLDRKSTRLN